MAVCPRVQFADWYLSGGNTIVWSKGRYDQKGLAEAFMRSILVTGSTGFVGRAVAGRLQLSGRDFICAVRKANGQYPEIVVGDIGPETDWRAALEGRDAVIHLAAQTPSANVTPSMFRDVNDLGTARLLSQAQEMGITTFIFVSSIFSVTDNAASGIVDDQSPEHSTSAYGQSKLAAEGRVAAFARQGHTGVSLRPPMIYGSGAQANWRLLQKIAATGLPLPFGALKNQRTLISIDNIADAIVHACDQGTPQRSGSYAVSDNESVSLADIVGLLRDGMGKSRRLLPIPTSAMTSFLRIVGRKQMAESLFGNLRISSHRFMDTFNWQPPESTFDGIRKSGRAFVDRMD